MTPPLPTALPVAYLRRSTVQSKKPGTVSHASQLDAVRKLADDPRLVILEDWGVSGQSKSTRKRTGYAKLRAMIAAGECSALFSYNMSRLARSVGELSSLIELCNEHGVTVRTVDREIDTGTATGRLIVHVLSAVDQFIAEIAAEHAAATRDTRAAAHDALGLPVPGSNPHYGTRHVTTDGITRIVPDPDRPIEPVLAAYREAGSVRGACELLQRRGILAPGGGTVWGSSATAKLLHYYVPDELPEPNARGLRRPVGRVPALFARLVSCHCGATMTPNAKRGQMYCAAGRDSGATLHGQYNVSERALRAVLEPAAARYGWRSIILTYKDGATDAERAGLEARKERTLKAYIDGAYSEPRWRAETAALDAKLADMARQERTVDQLSQSQVPEWTDVAAMNAHLRRIWTRVTLDAAMVPTVEWGVPAYMYDADAYEEYVRVTEAENAQA